jgi:regulator of nonsense transcripts 2
MISIIRAGYSPELSSGSRFMNSLDNDTFEAPIIKRVIVIKKIDPEEFEDQGVDDMGEYEDGDMSPEELDDLEGEIPPEIANMTMDELGLIDDDLDDLESNDYSSEDNIEGDDMTEEELKALEKEIPPEADKLKDEDLEADPDLDDLDDEGGSEEEEASEDETSDESGEEDSEDESKDKEEEDLDEGVKLDDYI